MKIRGKVLMAFSVGLALLVLQASATSYFISQLKTAVVTLDRAVHASKAAAAAVYSIESMQAELSAYSDFRALPALLDTIEVYKTDIDDQIATIKETSQLLHKSPAATDAISAALQVTNQEYTALTALPVSSTNEEALYEHLLYVEESLDGLAEESSKLIVTYEETLEIALQTQRDIRDRPTQAAFILCAAAAILLTLYALYFSSQLTGRIRSLAIRLQALTTGSIGQPPLVVEGSDELANLAASMNTMERKLIDVIVNIKSGTKTVDSGASEIAQGNLNLSTRTERQANNLIETSGNMLELSRTVHQNAENAVQADSLVSDAQRQAEIGGRVAGDAIHAMQAITSASKQISEITGLIDDIAFQTNLLALNAAVEAAHAGEQGRGFAVVASEVRNLAQRSAVAAKDIKHLIKNTTEKVDEGTRLVDQSGQKLGEIVNAVKSVTLVVTKIAEASKRQASGIEEITGSVAQLEEMTQQNAAMVQQAAAASEAMGNQAKVLHDQVSFFEVITSSPVR